jgi:hypothetical protein
MGDGQICLKISAALPLMTTYQMSLISAGSILLVRTFKHFSIYTSVVDILSAFCQFVRTLPSASVSSFWYPVPSFSRLPACLPLTSMSEPFLLLSYLLPALLFCLPPYIPSASHHPSAFCWPLCLLSACLLTAPCLWLSVCLPSLSLSAFCQPTLKF